MYRNVFFVALFGFLVLPFTTYAVSGINADDIDVEVETEQGDEWITVRDMSTDDDGVVRFKDALPGKYRFSIDEDDRETVQALGVEVRMLDEDGKRLRDETDVDAYIYLSDTKVFVATFETDDDGWLDLEGITHDIVYELDVRDDGSVKNEDDLARIKVKAKIDDSDWIDAAYKALETDPTGQSNGILELENVLPGKYKFKLKIKSGETYDPQKSFTLKIRMRDEDGKKIKKVKTVKIYAYIYGVKTKIAEMKTDRKGWLTIPGAQPGMKYKLKVK